MDRSTYVFGHRNPDADAICSAIAYADFKRRTEGGLFVAARCGNSNARIDAVLERFDTPLPVFIGDVTPRLRDAMSRELVTVGPAATCAEALALIERHDIQMIPVVDDGGRLRGAVSIFRLGRHFLPRLGHAHEMRRVETTIAAVVEALGARALHLAEPDRVQKLEVRVGAMAVESFDRFIEEEFVDPRRSVLVVGDRADIQERALDMGLRLLVVTGGLEVDSAVIERARQEGVSVIVSPWDTATTAWTIRAATRVAGVMEREMVEFSPNEKVSDVRRRTSTMAPAVFMVTTDEGRLVGVFTRRDLLRPSTTRIILVDHNELTQAVAGADEVQIVEVVDHHRLGDLRTVDPILFINRPVGSTCTIVADLHRKEGITPSPELAGIMMGGLVSDTLNLRSPTSTRLDREILGWLEELAGLTGSELAERIFSSGSVIASETPDAVVAMDRKFYEEGGVRFAISQVEEVGFGEFHERAGALLEALERSRAAEGLGLAALLVTDVKEQDSLLLVRGDPGVIESISYPAVEEGTLYRLAGVVSRKKQLLPFLTGILRRERV